MISNARRRPRPGAASAARCAAAQRGARAQPGTTRWPGWAPLAPATRLVMLVAEVAAGARSDRRWGGPARRPAGRAACRHRRGHGTRTAEPGTAEPGRLPPLAAGAVRRPAARGCRHPVAAPPRRTSRRRAAAPAEQARPPSSASRRAPVRGVQRQGRRGHVDRRHQPRHRAGRRAAPGWPLVDLDLQFGDVGVLLHLEAHPVTIDALAQRATRSTAPRSSEALATSADGVRVLLAPASPEASDLVTVASLEAILDAALAHARLRGGGLAAHSSRSASSGVMEMRRPDPAGQLVRASPRSRTPR